jgi:hypothetical protein
LLLKERFLLLIYIADIQMKYRMRSDMKRHYNYFKLGKLKKITLSINTI